MLLRLVEITSFRVCAPLLALLSAASLMACRHQRPQGTSDSSTPPRPSANAGTAPSAAASKLLASASAAARAKPKDPTLARIESRRPVALDEAAKRQADAYLKALGGGRKATSAKEYDRAETLFSTCLELSPDDPRALSERGYARLLAGKVAEADADFAAAAQHASNSILLQQTYTSLLCEWPDGKHAPCGSGTGGGNPVQSYCTWISHREELVVFDAQSFEGLVSITRWSSLETNNRPSRCRSSQPISSRQRSSLGHAAIAKRFRTTSERSPRRAPAPRPDDRPNRASRLQVSV